MILRLCDQCGAEKATQTSVPVSWTVGSFGVRSWTYHDVDLCDSCANDRLYVGSTASV